MSELYTINRHMYYNELKPLWDELSDVDYAVVKGEVLSMQIYSNPNVRVSNDLDILISKKHIDLIEKILIGLGFKQSDELNVFQKRENRIICLAYSHQISPYYKNKYGINLNVDINYDIFWGEYEGKRTSMTSFLSDVDYMDIYGYSVKTLPLKKAFIQLILHHYKEMNSFFHLSHYNCIRTELFKDIYYIIYNNSQLLNEEEIIKLSEVYDIKNIVYYMLYYTNIVFNTGFLNSYLHEFKNIDYYILDVYGLCSKEHKKWKIPFEDRLDNNRLWEQICCEMTNNDIKKIERLDRIFI